LPVLLKVTALFLLSLSSIAVAQDLHFQIEANRTKINDAPWDGVAGAGAGKGAVFFGLPTSGPPDLAVCVVTLDHPNNCLLNRRGNELTSICQNSFDCDFETKVDATAFGLVVVDLDKAQHDFVDAVILMADEGGDDSVDLEKLEAKVRDVSSKLSPPLTEGERQRRARELQKFRISDCSGRLECALRQSTLRIKE
jgi:hypothetical protein